MAAVTQSSKIKIFIVIGYSILILLAIYGVMRIYSELRTFSEYDRPFEERKELVLISGTLATLYESESMSRMLISSVSLNQEKKTYDSLMSVAVSQIDSLYKISMDPLLHSRLDSVLLLLDQKYQNTFLMFQLMDSINNSPTQKKSITTILSKKDVENLDRIYKMHSTQKQDTTLVQVKKKSLAQRVSDIFRTEVKDSLIVKNSGETAVVDSVYPVDNLADTIVQFMTDVIQDYDVKRNKYIRQLAIRQTMMFHTNQELTLQINNILYEMEYREYNKVAGFLQEKDRALNNSSKVVSRVALSALLTAIIFLLLSLRSISREQKYKRQLENAKRYAEDLLRIREKLMLTISHDIKAPLSSIIGYLELLTKSKLPTKEKYYLDNMQNSSEQVLELVTKLLDYHRLESGQQEVNVMRFSPYRLLNDIYHSFLPLAARKNLELKLVCDLDPDVFYQSDPFRIRQIINNLLSNAIKFTDEGTVTLTASLFSTYKEDVLNVTVKDTGVGIDQISQEKIFEEFNRLKRSETEGIEGSGLGLAISRRLILLLKGDIRVKSEVGVGSEFIINIPMMSDLAQTQNKTLTAKERNKLKILFIDDDLVLLNMYMELFQKEGFEPIMCVNSLDALTLLQNTSFDIVFTDIQMPDMNGFELVERIRVATFSGAKEMPIIALSARSDISECKYKEAGFSGFLAKPFSSEQLLNILVHYTGVYRADKKTEEGKGFFALTAFAGKDKEAARHIIKTFVQENAASCKNMENALSIDDWDVIRACAHKLLPLMRMIGADDLVTILYDLENNLRDESKVRELVEKIKVKNKEAEDFLKANELR